ncbi:MAG: tetratricopeptide repeat protein [Proteobacteria bacterium]|nr:tetratricopeptide repeat protein [Pseudomonadota bacterium]
MDLEEVERVASQRRALRAGSLIFTAVSSAVTFVGVSGMGVGMMLYGGSTGSVTAMEWGSRFAGLAVPAAMGFGFVGLVHSRRIAAGRHKLAHFREDGVRGLVPYGIALLPSIVLTVLLLVPSASAGVNRTYAGLAVAALAVATFSVAVIGMARSDLVSRRRLFVSSFGALLNVGVLFAILFVTMRSDNVFVMIAGVLAIGGLLFVKATLWPRLVFVWMLRPLLEADYDKALARTDWAVFGIGLRPFILVDADRLDETEELLGHLLPANKGRGRAQLLGVQALVHRRRGDDEKAEAVLLEALELGPEAGVLWSLAELAIERGNGLEGVERAESALACFSGGWEQKLLGSDLGVSLDAVRAWGFAVSGDEAAARRTLQSVDERLGSFGLHPRALAHWHLGLTLEALGEPEQAAERWRKCADMDPRGRVGKRAAERLRALPDFGVQSASDPKEE